MFTKTIFAAATIAVSMIAFQPAAQAGDFQVQIHLGGGHWGGHWGGGHWDDHWDGPWKLTCRQGRRKLRNRGYHHINAFDCYGKIYKYRVIRNGKIFRIRMNAYTGRYSRRFLGYA